jgi:hypothetical protein
VPTESKLLGTWQADLPPPQKVIYAFQKDHTYTITITGQAGAVQGTWRLDGSMLTTTLGSFAAYGMTNALPAVKGLSSQENVIVKLTGSTMVWRDRLRGSGLQLKRGASSAAVAKPPS